MSIDVATLRANLVADTSSYTRGLARADAQAGRFERRTSKSFGRVGTAAKAMGKTGAVALGVGLTVGIKKSIDSFREAQKVGRQTNAVLKSTGKAAGYSKREIESLATTLSKKTGIDDEAVQSTENLLLTFTKIGKQGGVFKKTTALALDMSAALGQDTKSSAIQLGKALNNPIKGVTALQRVGVAFTEQQRDQIKAMTESGNLLGAQKIILKEVATEFGGSAEAVATPMDKLKVTLDNIGETVGSWLVPAMDKGAAALNNFLTKLQSGGGAGSFLTGLKSNLASIGQSLGLTGRDMQMFGQAMANAFNFVKPVVDSVLKGIAQNLRGLAAVIGGVVKVISGILTGDFGRAWEGVKQIFSGALNAIAGTIRAFTAPFRNAAATAARGIGSGIKSVASAVYNAAKSVVGKAVEGVRAIYGTMLNAGKSVAGKLRSGIASLWRRFWDLGGWMLDKFVDGMKALPGKLKGLGKWIAKQIQNGLGTSPLGFVIKTVVDATGGKGGGNVGPLGKDKGSLGSATKLATKFGNIVTSGYRPGDPGWHGKNRARDYAGGNMIGFARAAASKFGGHLLELIHTPLGFGIKNGKKVGLGFWGSAVNADHNDHVHVAMRRGGKAGPNQGGPSVVYGEGKKTEWWVSQEGNRKKNIGYAMEALQSLAGNRLAMFKDGGKKWGASVFGGPGDPGTGHIGYKGDDLRRYPNSFAELNMGTAMGGLPYRATRWVTGPNGKTLKMQKRDIGRGGGSVNGRTRGIDLWYKAAHKLGVHGLGTVTVSKTKPSKGKGKGKGKAKSKTKSRTKSTGGTETAAPQSVSERIGNWLTGLSDSVTTGDITSAQAASAVGELQGIPGLSTADRAELIRARQGFAGDSGTGTDPAADLAAAMVENTAALNSLKSTIETVDKITSGVIRRAGLDMQSGQMGGRFGDRMRLTPARASAA